MISTDSNQTPSLDFVRDTSAALAVDDRALRRSYERGERVRLRRGVYIASDQWRRLRGRERHVALVRAVVGTRPGVVVGFESAAAVWGFPRLGRWPEEVHLVSPPGSGAHSRAAVREHRVALPVEDTVGLDGMTLTTPSRTLVDVARYCSALDAIVMIDYALNHPGSPSHVWADQAELVDLATERIGTRGRCRALKAIGGARAGASSPGETWSRLLMQSLGVPEPQLQTQHTNPHGGFYYTDFEWPTLGVIGEFDGRGKYLKPEYLGDATPGEAVVAEKVREDHLRAEGFRVARWMFDDLRTPTRLAAILAAVGLPVNRK